MYGKDLTYASCGAMVMGRLAEAVRRGEGSTPSGKRVCMTLFRHAGITDAPKWMSPQLVKLRHGRGPNSGIISNYQHLSQADVGEAVFGRFGLETEIKEPEAKAKKCPVCWLANPPDSARCGKPMGLQTAIQQEGREREEKAGLEERPRVMESQTGLPEGVIRDLQGHKGGEQKPGTAAGSGDDRARRRRSRAEAPTSPAGVDAIPFPEPIPRTKASSRSLSSTSAGSRASVPLLLARTVATVPPRGCRHAGELVGVPTTARPPTPRPGPRRQTGTAK